MDKFIRDKIDYQGLGLSYKGRIQSYIDAGKKCNVKVNDTYQVNVLRGENCDHLILSDQLKGLCDYLTIKRADKKAIHDWRHFQIIKNELCGEDREAIEIYPAESRLVDTANQYHLWVIPKGDAMPFGWKARVVDYTPQEGGYGILGQRGLNE